jgi:hypothetical protein
MLGPGLFFAGLAIYSQKVKFIFKKGAKIECCLGFSIAIIRQKFKKKIPDFSVDLFN